MLWAEFRGESIVKSLPRLNVAGMRIYPLVMCVAWTVVRIEPLSCMM